MKLNILFIMFLIIFCSIKSKGQIYTPTGVSVDAEFVQQEFSDPEIAAGNAFWMDSIINAG